MSRLNEEEKSRLAFLQSGKARESHRFIYWYASMCTLYICTTHSGVSPDSSAMLSPSDVSIDPIDGDTVSDVHSLCDECVNDVYVHRIHHF